MSSRLVPNVFWPTVVGLGVDRERVSHNRWFAQVDIIRKRVQICHGDVGGELCDQKFR